MTDLENIEKGIHFNRNYSKTGFTKKNIKHAIDGQKPLCKSVTGVEVVFPGRYFGRI